MVDANSAVSQVETHVGGPSYANPDVLEFYKTLPFNYRETVESSVQAIRETDLLSAYPVLKPLLRRGVTVLDVGCGSGWLSNAITFRHRATVTGIDFNPIAVARAREIARAMNLQTHFEVADLFTYQTEERFDVVVSIGVAHHTNNCEAALRRMFDHFLKPGGHAFIGLYHSHGRRPLLEHFQQMKRRGATEQEMFDRYCHLHSQLTDQTHLRSWFRDQVLHPHETQHTLEQIMPVLQGSGMTLVSTSINKFESVTSLASLYAQERKYHEIAIQRLNENRYFPGFFVFLARKGGAAAHVKKARGRSLRLIDKEGLLDTKPYIEHHSTFGYRYIPSLKMALPKPGGGWYHIQINSQGIRSDREYSFEKPKGVHRIVVCGDSMAAGQFVSNEHRFSEVLERRVSGLEVINLALEGSGTDQQLLLYEQVGLRYEHDFVVLMPFLQNIRRNMVAAREAIDPRTGQRLLRPKPLYKYFDGKLVLHNVPVPKEVSVVDNEASGGTDARCSWLDRLKTRVSTTPGAALLKRALYTVVPWEPFSEYRDPHSKEWLLMDAIIRRFKELAANRPLVLVPTFYSNYVRFRMARNYWDRYASLATLPNVFVIDLLPHFRRLGREAVRCFQDPHDMHFSSYGHLVLADALQSELTQLTVSSRPNDQRREDSSTQSSVLP